MLRNNDWLLMNSIAYKVHSIEDIDEMRLEIMRQLSYIIQYDSASFYLVDADNEHELCHPVGINYSDEDMQDYINRFKDIDYSEGLMYTGRNIAYKESDLVPDDIRINTEYYKAVYDVQGWHYSIHLNICYNGEFVGIMSFFRQKGKPDFDYNDIFALDVLKDHLAFRLHNERIREHSRKLTIEECADKYALSPAETSVLTLLVTDASTEEITDRLSISVSTFRKHCNHIYKKIGIAQRIQLYDIISS